MGAQFRPYLLAFLLSWLPFLLTWHQQGLRDEEERQKQVSRWEEEALRRVDQFRAGFTYQSQLEEMGSAMGRSIVRTLRKMPIGRIALTPEMVHRSFEESFPLSHRTRGAHLYGIAIDETGSAISLSGEGFTREKSRMICDLLKMFAQDRGPSEQERPTLDRRCAGLFGGSLPAIYTFDTFARMFRGRPLPVFFGSGRSFLIWQKVEWNRRLIGIWLALIPMEGARSARAIPTALQRLAAACSHEMFPALVPIPGLKERHPIIVPKGKRLPAEILAEIQGLRRGGTGVPQRDPGLVHRKGRFQFLREFASLQLPWELWMVGPEPSPPGVSPMLFLWGAALSCFWIGFGMHAWMLGVSSSLPLRRWFLGFFLLVGALPLSALAVNHLELIDALAGREHLDLRRETEQALHRLDAVSSRVFRLFETRCQQVFASRRWRQAILEDTPASIAEAGELARAAFRHHGLELELQLVYPVSGSPKAFPLKPHAPTDLDPRENLLFFEPYSTSVFAIYERLRSFAGIPARRGPAARAAPRGPTVNLDRVRAVAYNFFSGEDIGAKVLSMSRHADMIESDGQQVLHFHDLIVDGNEAQVVVFFRTRATPAFTRALSEATHRSNIPQAFSTSRFPQNTRFVLARSAPGGSELLVPEPTSLGFWGSLEGRQLHSLVNLAGRTGSPQQRQLGEHLMLAFPCRLTEGFLVGAVVPLRELTMASWTRLGEMFLTLLLLGAPIVFAALATGRSFVMPLAEMESILDRVRAGDLRQRLLFDRNDELGDLSRSFNGMIEGLERRRKLGRFVSGSVEADLAASAATVPEAPRERSGVVLVSDLRSFTTLSEQHPARDVTAMLNRHLETMSEVIRASGGHIDSFIGDAIVALFTDDDTDHDRATPPASLRGLRAAWEMTDAHRRLLERRAARGEFLYEIGIGLDAGRLMTGTLIATGRLQHVLMGEPRERAELLESASRNGSGRRIVVSRRLAGMVEPLIPGLRLLPLPKCEEGQELELLPGAGDRR